MSTICELHSRCNNRDNNLLQTVSLTTRIVVTKDIRQQRMSLPASCRYSTYKQTKMPRDMKYCNSYNFCENWCFFIGLSMILSIF